MPQAWLQLLSAIGGIILVDLALSGDNALVIGAATLSVPRRRRWSALAIGGGAAILLRLVFTSVASYLLQIPYLQAVGGLLVLSIAIRLFFGNAPHSDGGSEPPPATMQRRLPGLRHLLERHLSAENTSFVLAMLTILLADVTMSLDNVIAIGAIAQGERPVLIIGLLTSILLLLIGSALVAEILSRLPGLTLIASLILAWVAGNLVINDPGIQFLQDHEAAVYIATFGFVIAAALFTTFQRHHYAHSLHSSSSSHSARSSSQRHLK
jgi:YjbE family integral membrane protein